MKKRIFLMSLVLLFGLAGLAGASTCDGLNCDDGQYYFEDTISTGWISDFYWSEEYGALEYTHDLTDELAGAVATEAYFKIKFGGDWDGYEWEWSWRDWSWRYEETSDFEYVKLVFDYDYSSGWTYLGEIDSYDTYDMMLDIAYLNDDQMLDVKLKVYDRSWRDTADVWIDYSKVYGCAAPVPEPGTFLLLGAGLVGLFGYRRYVKK